MSFTTSKPDNCQERAPVVLRVADAHPAPDHAHQWGLQLLDGLIHHGKARWTAAHANKRPLGVCFDARC